MHAEYDLTEQVLGKERIFNGNYMKLDVWDVQLPDGRRAKREIVQVRDAVAILPVDRDGNAYLVRQYRPAIERTVLEIPAGLIDDGEKKEEAVVRECEEETGWVPESLQFMITYAHAMGYSTGYISLFLGTNLRETGRIHLDASEHLEPVVMPFQELISLVEKNEIVDPKTILAVLMAKDILEKQI